MKIFISYAEADFESFRIDIIAKKLEVFPEIEYVYYWRRDCKRWMLDYMEDGILNSDIIIVCSSENSINSDAVNQEIRFASYNGKEFVPIFRNLRYVRDFIRPNRGLKFDDEYIDDFIIELHTIIISEEIKARIINLTKLEYALKKGEQNEKTFSEFLEKGMDPLWIDFEREYIFRRKEIDKIIHKLNKNPRHLIIGNPASGKSFLVKYIGYELSREEDYDIFLIELDPGKDSLDVLGVLNELVKIKKEKTLVIIDDFHRGLTEKGKLICNQLIRGIGKNHKYKILISGRDTIPSTYLKYESELQILKANEESCTKLDAFDFAESVIKHFESKSSISLKLGEKEDFKERYGHDLWILSLALSLYDPDEGVTEEKKILKKIKQKIELYHSLHNINATDVFLPLSLLFQYETAVPIDLLVDKLDIDKESIFKLIDEGEIKKKHDNLLLHHSSRAKFYTKVYRTYEKLGKKIKDIIQKEFANWEIGIIHIYFQSEPENCIAFLSRLSSVYKAGLSKEGVKIDIISDLMDNINTRKAIINRLIQGMGEKTNLNSLMKRISFVAHLSFTKAFLNTLKASELIQFFNNSKLNQIGNFIAHHKVFYSDNLNSLFFDLFIQDFISKKIRDASLEEFRVFTNIVIINDNEVTFGPPDCRFTGKDVARRAFSDLEKLTNFTEKLKDSTLKTINSIFVNAYNAGCEPDFIVEKIKSKPLILRNKLKSAKIDEVNWFIYNVDKGTILKELENNSAFIIEEIINMNEEIFIQKMKESDLQQINYFFINFERNNHENLDYLMMILGKIDIYKLFSSDKLEEIVYFFIHMFIIENLKYFQDENIINILKSRLQDNKNNIGDKLALFGLFELSDHSFCMNHVQISVNIQELSKWFEIHTDPLDFHPTRVVLALSGLSTVNNVNFIKFCYLSLKLDSVLHGLKEAELKSPKIKQIVDKFILDLEELAIDQTRLVKL